MSFHTEYGPIKALFADKFEDVSLNLFIPGLATDGFRLDASGNPYADVLYTLSDFIPVQNGKTYNLYMPSGSVRVCAYNTSRAYTKILTNGAVNGDGFVIDFDGYIRVPTLLVNKNLTQVVDKDFYTGVFATNDITASTFNKLILSNIQKNSVKSVLSKVLTVKKTGDSVEIKSNFDSTNDIAIVTGKTSSANGSFNFTQTDLINLATGTRSRIHANTDDITPVRTYTTLGANHGHTGIVVITLVGHDKTTVDLGSVWTDGTTQYTLLKISGNDLTFGCPYTVTSGVVSASAVTPTANLTHVSGATHTATIDRTTRPSIGNGLMPSINNISCKYILDGNEITADGVYYGEELQVQESYNIMDYKAIIDYAKANIGVSYNNNNVGGTVRLAINYVFTARGSIVIHHNFRALNKVSLLECGFIQMILMALTGYKVFKYIPNVASKSGYDFKTPVDMTGYSTTVLLTSSDLLDPAIPPNRVIDWLKDSTTSVKKIGHAIGYIPDKSDGKHATRITNSAGQLWEVRTGSKTYPCAMRSITLNAGDYKNFICYRNYLSPEWDANATGFYIVQDKKDTYVFIDYHVSTSFASIKLNEHIGKTITVFEKSTDFTVHNTIVDADGVLFSVANNYGYAILKLT
jgi:hypothetical protein